MIRPVARIPAGAALAAAMALAITGCHHSGSSGSSGSPSASPTGTHLSLGQKFTTLKVCASLANPLQQVVLIGEQLTQKKLSPAQAKTKLQPIATQVGQLGQKNSSLPIGSGLTSLAQAITSVENVNPSQVSTVKTDGTGLVTAGERVAADCLAAR